VGYNFVANITGLSLFT